jgi:putative transposase
VLPFAFLRARRVSPTTAAIISRISMARRNRIVIPGFAYHVTQRGNRLARVFRDDEDRGRYLQLLREQSTRCKLWIWAYALMPNHIHAIVVPQTNSALSNAFRNVHSTYGNWFNKKYQLSGHLWQGRFYSCVLGESHLWAAVRYVERNPVRAGIVSHAEQYRWSSARSHVSGEFDPLLNPELPLIEIVKDWAGWLAGEEDDNDIKTIRNATAKDLPLGSEDFIHQLEMKLGRTLRPQKRGRKPGTSGNVEQQESPRLFEPD